MTWLGFSIHRLSHRQSEFRSGGDRDPRLRPPDRLELGISARNVLRIGRCNMRARRTLGLL
jgi:hypothetical protein